MSPRPLADALATLRRNGALGRVALAFVLAVMVEWAAWLALVVIAFGRGGPAEAGLVGFAVGLPAIIVAPTAAILGDRFPRSRVLLSSYVAQGGALASAASAFVLGAPLAGYALGVIAMALVALVRPLLGSLLPEVVRSPEELTAGNVASGLGEGFGALGGSLLAGVLFGLAGAPFVLIVGAATMVVASLLMLPLAVRLPTIDRDAVQVAAAGWLGIARAAARELGAGAMAIRADRRLTALAILMAATVGMLGALNVMIVVVAMDVLGFGQDAVGYLAAVSGIGALVGSLAATWMVGRERLAGPLLGSVIGFGVAIAAVGLGSSLGPVVVALALTGIGWSIAWVAATTMVQRLAGDDVMTRVFGVNESLQTGAEAFGGLLVPVLVVALGPMGTLIALGVGLATIVALTAPTLLRADRVDPGLLRDLPIVRAVPMFAPLAGPVLERLAARAEHWSVETGAVIVKEGDQGDRFYIVVDGEVQVATRGRAARVLGRGSAFGEIALIRDVPRTATVQAIEPTELLAFRREPFLEALTGQARSRAVATAVVEDHLAADHAAS